MQHFINLTDLKIQDLQAIIDAAIMLKNQRLSAKINNKLAGQTLAMIFDKSSTRTRVSFEAGMTQLGGHALFLSSRDIQLGRGEPITDSAIVISSMVDLIMLRISSHYDLENFAKHSSKPVINALSDQSHPCQLLADMMTFKSHRGSIKGASVAWVGDGNNMCQTYMQAAKVFDFTLKIAAPKGFLPSADFVDDFGANVQIFDEANAACQNADLVITDVWASMGNEASLKKRKAAFAKFQVSQKLMNCANKDAIFMHCLPAHRGEEVSAEVIDGKQSVVWDEAENRLHTQKALLLFLSNKL